ncbi:MAG: PIG-L deacetylase family protein [Pseudomonadota bacterium]
MYHPDLSSIGSVLLVGAHADDIEIGCGGALLQLIDSNPNIRVYWLVMSANGVRLKEAEASAQKFLATAKHANVRCESFTDTLLFDSHKEIKALFSELRGEFNPDLVITHRLEDRHQDHRLLGEVCWNTFRDNLILEYEIPKYEGDLGQPNLYFRLEPETVKNKVDYLTQCFTSQFEKNWFSRETFESLMRIRGIECNAKSGYAEAFYCRKIVV